MEKKINIEGKQINSQSSEQKGFLQREIESIKHEKLHEIEYNLSETEAKIDKSHNKSKIMKDKIEYVRRNYADSMDSSQAEIINKKNLLKKASDFLRDNDEQFIVNGHIKLDDLKEAFSIISVALDKEKSAEAVLEMQQETERCWEDIRQEINSIGNKIMHLKEKFTLNPNEKTVFNEYIKRKEKLLNLLRNQEKQYGFYITDRAKEDMNKIKEYYKQSIIEYSDYTRVNDWLFNSGNFKGHNPRQGKDKI